MMKTQTIQLVKDCSFAPCSFLAVKVINGKLADYRRDESASVLFQCDYDWPGLASTFGWSLANVAPIGCCHDSTDGTVKCEHCGTLADAFIAEARQFLDDCAENDTRAEDPGYFTS